jgi:hypothetical protein
VRVFLLLCELAGSKIAAELWLGGEMLKRLCVLVGLLASVANAANILTNPDFSAGNTGFSSQYSLGANLVPEGNYTVGANPHDHSGFAPSFGDHTTGTGLMLMANGHPFATAYVWRETLPVAQGTVYTLSGWTASFGHATSLDPSPAVLRFTINGTIVGNVNVSNVPGTWTSFSHTWNSGGAVIADIRIADLNAASNGNDFALDDLGFAPIPEPCAGAMLACATVLIGARRKR